MTPLAWTLIIIAIIAIAVVVILQARTKKLKSRFGPEYDRVVREQGGTLKAQNELEHRAKRVEKFRIRPLSPQEMGEFATQWQVTQQKFVDDPKGAVADADRLVHRTMKARGYPAGLEFDDQAADLSVDHPGVVQHYRAAHDIALKDERNQATTEDLRLAMQHYRALFEDLLGKNVEQLTETGTGARR